MGSQTVMCCASECKYWLAAEGGCVRESVTIEDKQCLNYEETEKVHFTIVVSGGAVQNVYTSLPIENVMVDVLDHDQAKRDGPEAALEMMAQEDHAQSVYNTVF